MEQEYQYDYFVIGGGSGGLASASAAASHGAKVGLADYVTPSPQGTKWGLGGTCVNVGCIPKKLFHYASLLGESREDLNETGWKVDPEAPNKWAEVAEKIQDHVKSLNWGYKKKLTNENITYYNKKARLLEAHKVELKGDDNQVETVTAKYILIAVGGRPNEPGIPGGEHSFNSDDIFWMKEAPGKKVLVVGASYIALECGGFMKGLGLDVTVMVRSILLRGFDQQMAEKIGEYMANQGVKFIKKATPVSITLNKEGKKVVRYKQEED